MIKPKVHIELNKLAVGYLQSGKPITIKEDINLTACPGELIALIGSNGIGKSTLLRTLCGFQESLFGDILLNNRAISKYKTKELAKLLSFVSTEIVRVQNMRVRELLALGRFPYTNLIGSLTEEDNEIIDRSIKQVGLIGYENRMINQLSDGERQRAMIARTLVQDTPVIILDEPTAFLDISNKYEIIHLLHELARNSKKTIIFSTHDLNIATSEVDKIWLMLEDEITQGAPEDLILKGFYHKVFASENILFDEYSGIFRLKKNYRGSFSVEAEGIVKNWTIHALARAGFIYVSKSENAEIKINYNETAKSWSCTSKQCDKKQYFSIYDLVNYLSQSFA